MLAPKAIALKMHVFIPFFTHIREKFLKCTVKKMGFG
jgi:hypothetical protein